MAGSSFYVSEYFLLYSTMHKEVVTKRIQIKKTTVKYKYRQGIPHRYLSVSKKSVAFPHAVAHAYLGEDV
ncbi:MAG: hypothetical protein U0N59_01055, partial [Oscillospiraceae bacterium]